MAGYGWVSFTTDYGLIDGFVAACYGVIARSAPSARVIDVTHQVTPGDVRRGAAVLAETVPYLPPAVHLAVVDPGVGTRRRAIAIEAPGGLLVGPDNGLLPWAADALGGPRAAVTLDNPRWLPSPVSWTFHGRDIFAPVAARLAAGEPLAEAGPPVDVGELERLPAPVVRAGDGWLEAEVLTVDRFGNLQLAAAAAVLPVLAGTGDRVTVAHAGQSGGAAADGAAVVGGTFADVPPGDLVVLVDSAGRVALAVNGGRAADLLGVVPGDLLRLSLVLPGAAGH